MRDITQLHPELQEKIAQLKKLCEKEGLILGIGECFRTVEEQDALYAQGRTAPGSKVTNAKGSTYSSQHQWGIAFDFFKNVKGHAYDDDSFFNKVGKLAKSIGLGWGGDWKSFVDKPHLYLPDWGSNTTKLKQEYGTPDKFKKTWNGVKTVTIELNVLRKGDKGEQVKTLQRLLIMHGFPCGDSSVDGSFGGATETALKKYQKMYDLEVDGVCGKATWTSLLK